MSELKRKITLLVTNSIKGELKKHQIHTISITDYLVSSCPHFLDYGDYHAKQIYFNSGKHGENSYRYRTVREAVKFSALRSRKIIFGKLGERVGKVLEIEGAQPKKEGNSPFEEPDDYFQASKVDGKEKYGYLTLKLDPKFSAAGGKLPELGKKVTIEGYESITVHPFSDEKKMNEMEKEQPKYYGQDILGIVFMVTKVTEKNDE